MRRRSSDATLTLADDTVLHETRRIISRVLEDWHVDEIEHRHLFGILRDYADSLLARDICPLPITPRRIVRFLDSEVLWRLAELG